MSDKTTIANGNIILSGESLSKFKQAIKVGFYKDFYKSGIINSTQFEKLMQIQNNNRY
jgi:hypothetical protein